MEDERMTDAAHLWRRVGLAELRVTLARVGAAHRELERALQDLPECDTCARTSLLEQIRASGSELSREAVSVTLLAECLKEAVGAAERAQRALTSASGTPCACPGKECTCHE